MSDKVKYPPQVVERKEGAKNADTDSKKYQDIVNSHPIESTSVTRKEKYKKKQEKEEPEDKLEKQALEARVKNNVKKW